MLFSEQLEENLLSLHTRLASGSYRHGRYASFYITDPKRRHIHKASVKDRLLHHAIHRVIEPLFESGFIFDSYSSRKGKGTHAAMNRVREFAWGLSANDTKTVWFLKCDIRKFFDSIKHSVLLSLIQKRIPNQELLCLLGEILWSFKAESGTGLPLGNLTSQLFANVYLDPLDQFVKRELKIQHYVRYADDFVLMSRAKQELGKALSKIRWFLSTELSLGFNAPRLCRGDCNKSVSAEADSLPRKTPRWPPANAPSPLGRGQTGGLFYLSYTRKKCFLENGIREWTFSGLFIFLISVSYARRQNSVCCGSSRSNTQCHPPRHVSRLSNRIWACSPTDGQKRYRDTYGRHFRTFEPKH